ncbi:MAG: ISAzo13-like element transposase-related protein, partial [Acidobacteriaceae bacterium]
TKTGLKVKAKLDKRKYPLKVEITDEQMRSLNIEPHEFHGEWNLYHPSEKAEARTVSCSSYFAVDP